MIKKIRLSLSFLDWLFIIGLVLIGVFFFFFFKRENSYALVKLKITDPQALYARNSPGNEYATSFSVGDKEIDEFGNTIAEITDIESYPIDNMNKVIYVTVKLSAIYNKRNNSYSYQGKKIIFGESFNFFFSKVKFSGLVVDFPGYMDPKHISQKTMTIQAQLIPYYSTFSDDHGVPDYIANALHVGDEVKNSKGEVLAKVLKIDISPAVRTTVTQDGQVKKESDPVLKDVLYTLSLNVQTVAGTNYALNYTPVTLGQQLPLVFRNITVTPIIVQIEK